MSCKHDTHPHESRTLVVTAHALEFACIFCELESLRAQVASGAHCSGCGVKLGDSWCAKCATAAEVVRLRAECEHLRADRNRIWPVWKLRYTIRHKLGYLLRDYPDDKETASIIAAIAAAGVGGES